MARTPTTADAFNAVAEPRRRELLDALAGGERSVGELVEGVGMHRPGVPRHLKVLRDAGLVQVRVDGNQRLYRVDLDRLSEVRRQLERFWGERLGRLAAGIAEPEER